MTTTIPVEDIDFSLVGVGNYVTYSLLGGAYETNMIVGSSTAGFEVIVRSMGNVLHYLEVPFETVLGIGETPGEAAEMKDRTFAARRANATNS